MNEDQFQFDKSSNFQSQNNENKSQITENQIKNNIQRASDRDLKVLQSYKDDKKNQQSEMESSNNFLKSIDKSEDKSNQKSNHNQKQQQKQENNAFFDLNLKEQVRKSLGLFNKLDKDNDGQMTFGELMEVCRGCCAAVEVKVVKGILDKYQINYSQCTFQDLLTVFNDLSLQKKNNDQSNIYQNQTKFIGINYRLIEFLKLLNEYKTQCIEKERNYTEANKIQDKLNKIKVKEIERWKININCIHKEELQEQEKEQLEQVDKLEEKWEKQIKDIDIKSLKFLQSVQEKQNVKMDDFRQQVERQSQLKIKADSNIQVLRRQEKHYANMQDYIGAGQIKRKVDQLEQQDIKIKNKLREKAQEKKLEQFVQKQQSSYEGQLQRIIKLREQLVLGKEKEKQQQEQTHQAQKEHLMKLQKKECKHMADTIHYVFHHYDTHLPLNNPLPSTHYNPKRGRKLVSINNNTKYTHSKPFNNTRLQYHNQTNYNNYSQNNNNPYFNNKFNKSTLLLAAEKKVATEPNVPPQYSNSQPKSINSQLTPLNLDSKKNLNNNNNENKNSKKSFSNENNSFNNNINNGNRNSKRNINSSNNNINRNSSNKLNQSLGSESKNQKRELVKIMSNNNSREPSKQSIQLQRQNILPSRQNTSQQSKKNIQQQQQQQIDLSRQNTNNAYINTAEVAVSRNQSRNSSNHKDSVGKKKLVRVNQPSR